MDISTGAEVEVSAVKLATEFVHEASPAVPVAVPSSTPSSRFAALSSNDIDHFVVDQQNSETVRKTKYHVTLFKQYLQEVDEHREIADIPPHQLDPLVGNFLCVVRKEDGTEYEPSYLRGMLSSLERHLRLAKYEASLVTSLDFFSTREKLKAKQKNLRKHGKGNLPHKADTLTDDDVNKLYADRQLGAHTPQSVINTLWLNNMLHFGMRAVKEHRSLCWGDVKLKRDADGREFIEMTNEHQTKTRTGENVSDVRPVKPQMYSYPDDKNRCPVALYKFYASLRPKNFMGPETPFYLAIKNTPQPSDAVWFKRQAMGPNTIAQIMKNMAGKSGISCRGKRLTNTSARKYLLQKLNDNNVPPTHTMQKSAHKNVQSVNNYCKLSDKQQYAMSHILTDTSHQQLQSSALHPRALTSSTTSYMTSKSSKTHSVGSTSIFENCTIAGGTFNVTCNIREPPCKRKYVIYSDTESENSQ
ncbi:uncharacterized protein KIAA1958 homolog [Ptychodera flava]|uniref:uncharacterized protein KIAA1958 homolog n=1 Tax=Ptychodera flava TaxID=63121 RepID=UPI00396A81F3